VVLALTVLSVIASGRLQWRQQRTTTDAAESGHAAGNHSGVTLTIAGVTESNWLKYTARGFG
jgi:hypothetical protein